MASSPDKYPKGGLWLLAAGFALLMSLPFLVPHLGFLSLVAFVPLFFLDELLRVHKVRHAFWYYFCAFLAFNIATTFWIWFVSGPGAIAAIILNALQMAAVFAICRWGAKVIPPQPVSCSGMRSRAPWAAPPGSCSATCWYSWC